VSGRDGLLGDQEPAGPSAEAGATGPPPWILGYRGLPLEAPENTLAGMQRAIEAGADGVHYPVRACETGEAVVMADATLERTTDGTGRVGDAALPRLFSLDAGGWFEKGFVGESVPLLDEVLELGAGPTGEAPLHAVELAESALAGTVVRRLVQAGAAPRARVLSPRREDCLELTDGGLQALLLAPRLDRSDLNFVRDEGLAGVVAPAGGWCGELAREPWPCERWELGVEDPDDLLRACRTPVAGLITAEPRRALAVRALAALTPADAAPFPVGAPELTVEAGHGDGGGGQWCGRWRCVGRLRNPFGHAVRVRCQVFVRRGAFDVSGLPTELRLEPAEEREVPLELAGGSWSPGGDPLLAALYSWGPGPGRRAGKLLLDAPLVRRRRVVADTVTRRVGMLRESPAQAPASMTVRRRGAELLVAIENAGGLLEATSLATLDGAVHRGGSGLRLALPPDFEDREGGVPFSCGFVGRARAPGPPRRELRRWAGGLPAVPGSGSAGRLLPLAGA
jgi:hypothetical protein